MSRGLGDVYKRQVMINYVKVISLRLARNKMNNYNEHVRGIEKVRVKAAFNLKPSICLSNMQLIC